MPDAALKAALKEEFDALGDDVDEQSKRDWAVKKAISLGRSGKIAVHWATGIALTTIRRGIKNLQSGNMLPEGRRRRPGAGRRAAVEHDPKLVAVLYRLLQPRGNDRNHVPIQWTTQSTRRLAEALAAKRHPTGATTVLGILKREGFHVEANRRSLPGQSATDRDAQFQRIVRRLISQRQSGGPALAVEMRARRPSNPAKGQVKRRFAEKDQWELVGISRETVGFTVLAIRDWWEGYGAHLYPETGELLVITDSRVGDCDRTWKTLLQRLADVLQLTIHVSLLPAATYRWAALECQLVSRLRGTVRGRTSVSHEVLVSLVGSGTGQPYGPPVETEVDAAQIEQLSSGFMNERFSVDLRSSPSSGAYNYAILPRPTSR